MTMLCLYYPAYFKRINPCLFIGRNKGNMKKAISQKKQEISPVQTIIGTLPVFLALAVSYKLMENMISKLPHEITLEEFLNLIEKLSKNRSLKAIAKKELLKVENNG
jgi:hypothetical protein